MDYSPYNPYSLLFLIGSLVCAKSLQLCPTLLNPMDCRLPGSSIHGTIQARILEWVAISFSRRSFPPRDQTCVSCITCIGRLILYHYSTREVLLYQGIHTAEKHKQTNKQNPQVILIKKCEIFDRLLCSVRWSSVQRLRLSLWSGKISNIQTCSRIAQDFGRVIPNRIHCFCLDCYL